MAHNKSALKRIRQNKVRQLRNRSIKSKVKTYLKKVVYAIKNNKASESKEAFCLFASILDKAVNKNIYHKNTAARKKSKLMREINLIEVK